MKPRTNTKLKFLEWHWSLANVAKNGAGAKHLQKIYSQEKKKRRGATSPFLNCQRMAHMGSESHVCCNTSYSRIRNGLSPTVQIARAWHLDRHKPKCCNFIKYEMIRYLHDQDLFNTFKISCNLFFLFSIEKVEASILKYAIPFRPNFFNTPKRCIQLVLFFRYSLCNS